jgi:predicted component of type VI protein secretion system
VIHLYVTLKDRAVGHFELSAQRVRIGRHPDNEVQIDSMAISRHHCALERLSNGGWRVEDLGSNNGTLVNGARIAQPTAVREGDVLGIGKFQVSFRGAPDPSQPRPSPAAAHELREDASSIKGFLVLLNRRGPTISLERDLFVIGAEPGADLSNPGAAKQALLVRGYGGFQAVDVSPTGGLLRRNGIPVGDRCWLEDEDVLRVGELELEFHLGSATEGQSTMTLQAPVGGFKLPPDLSP